MVVAAFDLDDTLLAHDTDRLWGAFAYENGLVTDVDRFLADVAELEHQYAVGNLDSVRLATTALGLVSGLTVSEAEAIRDEFFDSAIKPHLQQRASEVLDQHRAAGDAIVVVTASNRFFTAPTVAAYGIEHLLAFDVEIADGVLTGKPTGVDPFGPGKVTLLKQWAEEYDLSLAGAYFYSDAYSDEPLLRFVDNPVAVDPDERLRKIAEAENWPIITFRE